MLRSKLEQQQQRQGNHTLLDDNKIKIIEKALDSYHRFIDFLHEADLGRLIDLFEMNQGNQQQSSSTSPQPPPPPGYNNSSIKRKKQPPSSSYSTATNKAKSSPPPPPADAYKLLTDQQKYFSSKISQAKARLRATREHMNENSLVASELLYDASMLNETNASTHPTSLDALVYNALDISRKLNSSNAYNANSTIQQQPNPRMRVNKRSSVK